MADVKALAKRQKEKAERDEHTCIYRVQRAEISTDMETDFRNHDWLENVGGSNPPLTNPCQVCFNRNAKYTFEECNHSMCRDCIKRQFCSYLSAPTSPWCSCVVTKLRVRRDASTFIETHKVKKWMFRNSAKFEDRVWYDPEPTLFNKRKT